MRKKYSYVIYFHFDERLEFHGGFNELFDIGIYDYVYQNVIRNEMLIDIVYR